DAFGLAGALTGLGLAAFAQADYETARAAHSECLALVGRLGHPVGEGWSLANLAESALAQGELAAAQRHYGEAIEVFRRLQHGSGVADCLVGSVDISMRAPAEADAARAACLLGAAAALREAARSPVQPPDRARFERLVTDVRGALDAERFQ